MAIEGWSELEKVLGGSVTVTGLLLLGGRWLIGAYFAKAKENEELKATNARIQENRLDETVKNFRAAMDSIQGQVKDLSANLTLTRQESVSLKDRIEKTEKLLEQYTNSVDTKVANMIRSEVTNLTKQLMLIRTKKNGP